MNTKKCPSQQSSLCPDLPKSHNMAVFLLTGGPWKASVPRASFAKVSLLTRSQIKMSLSTVVDLDALRSGTISTCGNDVRRYDSFAGTSFSNRFKLNASATAPATALLP